MENFRSCFGNVAYFIPLEFYDSTGRDWTASIHKTPLPANVYFLEIQDIIPLSIVNDTFDIAQQRDLSYLLHLPQTLDGTGGSEHVFGKGDESDSITTLWRSLFSNATNLYPKFSVTLVRNENCSQDNALPSDIFITTPVTTARDQGANVDNDAKSYAGDSKADYKADKSNSNHSSFDMKKLVMLPK